MKEEYTNNTNEMDCIPLDHCSTQREMLGIKQRFCIPREQMLHM